MQLTSVSKTPVPVAAKLLIAPLVCQTARLNLLGAFLLLAATGIGCNDSAASDPAAVLTSPAIDEAAAASSGDPTRSPTGQPPLVAWENRAGEDWPAFLGPRGDGTSSEVGVDPELWDPHPPIVWVKQLGTSYGAPTVVKGRLLQFDRFADRERLSCFDALTGKEIWRHETVVSYSDMYGYNNGPRCSPITDGELVFTYGVTGNLTCVRLTDGKQIWAKDMLTEYGVVPNFFGVASNPFIYKDLLLVMVGGSPPESHNVPAGQLDLVEPNGSAIVALDKSGGEEVYRLGDELASYASMTVREIAGEPTGLAFLRGGLIAWRPETGKELFRFPWRAPMLSSVNAAMPVVSGNQLFLSEAYEVGSVLLEVNDQTATVVWQDGGPRSRCKFRAHWSTPILIDGYLYGGHGRNAPDSDFRCIRFSDGQLQWVDGRRPEGRHPSDTYKQRSSVLAIDGYLIALGEDGRLELIRPSPDKLEILKSIRLEQLLALDGKPLLNHPCWAAPIVSRGLLYLRGPEHLVCFNLIPQS